MIYITYVDLYDTGYYGITKKILSQISVFQQCFGRVFYTVYKGQMIYLMEGKRIIDKDVAVTRAMCNTVIEAWLDKYKIKRTYIRYSFANKWFIQFLKAQRKKGIKSVLEIPTYPYDGELENGKIKMEDEYYREFLSQYIDWVATNSEKKRILGMSCIRLLNGVDLATQPLRLKSKEKKKITLIGVSSMAIWHGYERILKGLSDYYSHNGEYDFLFKMVGSGPEEEKYHFLTKEYGLQSRVEFCGMLGGKDLDRQYELSDVAVSSLGLYKTHIHDVTPIKGAEYCARGIPFICGYHDMRFPEGAKYIMQVPNTPEPVDMKKVIDFYENLTVQSEYSKEMRDYADRHFSWESIMRPIVELLR